MWHVKRENTAKVFDNSVSNTLCYANSFSISLTVLFLKSVLTTQTNHPDELLVLLDHSTTISKIIHSTMFKVSVGNGEEMADTKALKIMSNVWSPTMQNTATRTRKLFITSILNRTKEQTGDRKCAVLHCSALKIKLKCQTATVDDFLCMLIYQHKAISACC